MVGATYLRYTSMRHMGSDEKKTAIFLNLKTITIFIVISITI